MCEEWVVDLHPIGFDNESPTPLNTSRHPPCNRRIALFTACLWLSAAGVDDQPAQAEHRSANPEGSARSSASSRSTSSPQPNT